MMALAALFSSHDTTCGDQEQHFRFFRLRQGRNQAQELTVNTWDWMKSRDYSFRFCLCIFG
jgi:hypothetical protein